jgi:hypothetical protein
MKRKEAVYKGLEFIDVYFQDTQQRHLIIFK